MSEGKRPAPAYLQYAATRLADRAFKLMRLPERGLLHSMELETWANGSVPADPASLARVLGLDPNEVAEALTSRVLALFTQVGDDLVHPSLEAYRQKLDAHRRSKSDAGRKGAQERWKHGNANSAANADANGNASGNANGSLKPNQTNQNQSAFNEAAEHVEFRRALEGPAPFEEAAARSRAEH